MSGYSTDQLPRELGPLPHDTVHNLDVNMAALLQSFMVALALISAGARVAMCAAPDTTGSAPSISESAPQIKLAIIELRVRDAVTIDEAEYLTDCVRGTAARALPTDRCLVMTRDNIQALLPEGQNLTDCSVSDCSVETGRQVGADYIVSGEIIRFDGALRLALKAYDCTSGALLWSESAAGANPSALEKGLAKSVAPLFATVGAAAGIPLNVSETTSQVRGEEKPEAAAGNSLAPPSGDVAAPVVAPPSVREVQPAVNPDTRITVFVTKSGTCYHREGCTGLRRSCIPMSLVEAAARYRPCSVCAPPRPSAGGSQAAPQGTRREVRQATPRESAPAAGRCQATTKKGTQCSRAAKAGSRYCWQHGG